MAVKNNFIYFGADGLTTEAGFTYITKADMTPEGVSGFTRNNSFKLGVIPPYDEASGAVRDMAIKVTMNGTEHEITLSPIDPYIDETIMGGFEYDASAYCIVAMKDNSDGTSVVDLGFIELPAFTPVAVPASVKDFSIAILIPQENLSFVEPAKTPVAADLLEGRQAWANGVKLIGTGTGGGGGGGGEWQPDPLWTDIRDLYDNDPLAGTYTYRAVYLIAAADTSTVFQSGARYITSDGYDSETELFGDYTHTWNQEMDMIDSKGVYTRWVKVYDSTAITDPYNFNNTPLWVVLSLGTSITGTTSASTSIRLSNCFALQCVEIESIYTTIGDFAFYSCYSLEKVVIPNSVLTIGNNAFEACRSLDNVVIPASVSSIGNVAFVGCARLNSVTIQGTTITFVTNAAFNFCRSLSVINLASGFDSDFHTGTSSATILLSRQVLNAMIAAYKDNSGGTARTLTIGETNLAKLTVDDIAVATAKNLSLA